MKRRKPAQRQTPHAAAPGSPSHGKAVQDNSVTLKAAFALHQGGQLDSAEALYRQILASQPEHFDALQLLAAIFMQRGSFPDALAMLERALRINPNHATTLSNHGTALRELKRFEEALTSYDRALRLVPAFAPAHYNMGNALQDLNRSEEAVRSYDRAIGINPDFADAHYNRGNALHDLKLIDSAIASYERALKIRPDHAETLWNASQCRLLTGDFAAGWRMYESRWDNPPLKGARRGFARALWLGDEPLAGKTILLQAEQGFGDFLQFCRYVPLVAARGARVLLEVPASLKTLCASLPGEYTLVTKGEALPDFDLHTPLLSLPLAFGTQLDSIPADIPYLRADPEKVAAWHVRLGKRSAPRIGIAWSGRPTHPRDALRSLPFALMAELAAEDAEFVCLQGELRSADYAEVCRQGKVRIVSELLKDFDETAALIETLDLVITVDTAIAHLAGALGKPAWIMLPFVPDWRWLLEREDSPWYPGARLFRQPQAGQWQPVVAEVKRALAKLFKAGDSTQGQVA